MIFWKLIASVLPLVEILFIPGAEAGLLNSGLKTRDDGHDIEVDVAQVMPEGRHLSEKAFALGDARNQWTKSPPNARALIAGTCSTTFASMSVPLGDTVRITSPKYPRRYPRGTLCGGVYTTSNTNEFNVECTYVDIGANDFLTIADSSGTTIVQYTDHHTAIPSFGTGESSIKLTLRAQGTQNGYGFVCSITATARATTVPTTTNSTESNTNATNAVCLCGKKLNSRIVGGTQASVNEYPWMVGMAYEASAGVWYTFCGGSLISSEWVATAAHCLSVQHVMIGQYDLYTLTPPAEIKVVRQTIQHPSYRSRTNDYDIALLRIDPINFATSPTIRPICLPDNLSENYVGQTATVTGWGITSSGGTSPYILREVDIPVISNTQCASMYGSYTVTARMLCAASPNGGLDSCQGDSGGPLVAADGANYELVGIVSWGVGCALVQYPGVYTRVTEVTNWIIASTNPAGYCPRA